MHVLVVEDDSISAEMLENALQELGQDVTIARDGQEAFRQIRTGRFRLVVSDWSMPGMSGPELCREIRQRRWSRYIYVILLTSYESSDHVVRGLDAGADDFLTKPFQPQELLMRLHVGERMLTLESRDLTIFALAKLAESRDPETGAHLERIREYTWTLAEELSCLRKYEDDVDGEYIRLLYLTSPLHDIGKVGIPDSVLLKPGKLDSQQYEIMKQHTVIGANTLQAAAVVHSEAQFLTMARDIALTHHERYDGAGYPYGLAGEAIPLAGRITALADVYDALTSKRVYKPAYSHETAREMILEQRAQQFDPDIVDAFLNREDAFIAIRQKFDDNAFSAEQSLGSAAAVPDCMPT